MTRITSLVPVDTTPHQKFFSSFPIKDCWVEMDEVVQWSLRRTIERCTLPGTREHRKALYRHDNPAGNLFSLCFGYVETERMTFVVQFIEFLCIIDDVLEDLPHNDALIEHDILIEALRSSRGTLPTNATSNTRLEWVLFLQDLKAELLVVDPVRSPALLLAFEESLKGRDSLADEFDTIEQYLPYRLINFDYEFVTRLVLWAMDIDVPSEELNSDVFDRYKYSIGVIVGLVNDYFSWEREKRQQQDSDRIRNGVAVLMKQHRISDRDAKEKVKTILIGEEHDVLQTSSGWEDASEPMRRYLNGLEMFAGGYSFWCSTCPRYSKPEGDSDPVTRAPTSPSKPTVFKDVANFFSTRFQVVWRKPILKSYQN